jgi:hypothetical protein
MVAILKTTQIQEPSSATVNLTLDTSGGVTVGGATTFTGGIASAGVPIKGSSSGTTTLVAASAASGTVTIPAGTGTVAVQGVSSNIVSGTAVASTSGTSVDFTSIPSWVKRITVILRGFSTSGTSNYLLQLGSGSVQTTGYLSTSMSGGTGVASIISTSGMIFYNPAAAGSSVSSGSTVFVNISGNAWVCTGTYAETDVARMTYHGGDVSLSGTLDRVRLTTVNGTDTFDAGTVNIFYE